MGPSLRSVCTGRDQAENTLSAEPASPVILVVEDDDHVRDMIASELEEDGFTR
jgi:hypothetical protein